MKWQSYAVLILSLATTLNGCSKEPICLIADSLVEIKSEALKSHNLYLFLRTSGLHDKAQFYELYQTPPEINACGNTAINPITEVFIDTSLGHPDTLLIIEGQLVVEYSEEEAAAQSVIIDNQL